MSALHYQLWRQASTQAGQVDGLLLSKVASGTITLAAAASAPVAIPGVPSPSDARLVAILKVVGADRAYVEFRNDGLATAQTGAHAPVDAVPRTLVGAEDGAILEHVPAGGTFTAVLAATI